MEMKADTKTVYSLFSSGNKYIVPRFQREFSWENAEIDDFWDDIIKQIHSGTPIILNEYFLGCIVLIGDDTRSEFIIVDGQQRLTTLTLLLRAIIARLYELEENAAADGIYANVIEGNGVDGKPYFKLISESPKPYLQNEIQAKNWQKLNEPETEEEKRLKRAYVRFFNKIKSLQLFDLKEIEAVNKLRDQILNYLKFIVVTAKNEEDAYTIFETLNARGMSLTSVDLIKNWIFKNDDDTHPNDNAKEIWKDLRERLSSANNVDLETFFRHYWNSKYEFTSSDRLYKSFQSCLAKGRIENARDFLLELQEASNRYLKFTKPTREQWKSATQKEKVVVSHFELMNQYRVSQVNSFLLALLEVREKKLIDETKFVTMIKNLENFHFTFTNLCSSRASGLENLYSGQARALHIASSDKNKIKEIVDELTRNIQSKQPSLEMVKQAIKSLVYSKDSDSDKRKIQTIFGKIENSLHETEEFSVQSISLEHIKDQINGQSSWEKSIANLIPLDEKLNNEIGKNKSFEAKKVIYEKSSFKLVAEFLKQNSTNTWDESISENWLDYLSQQLYKATKVQ